MTPWPLSVAFPLTLLGSIVLIVAFDAAAAWLTRKQPAFYRRLWPLQFALYVVIGFLAMFAVLDLRLVETIGAITGFVEATLGWIITWRIGPGRIAKTNRVSIAIVVASMIAFGFGFSIVGALIFNAVAAALIRSHQ